MPKTILADERHVTIRIPASLPEADTRAVRRTLAGADFTARLRAAVRSAVRSFPELAAAQPAPPPADPAPPRPGVWTQIKAAVAAAKATAVGRVAAAAAAAASTARTLAAVMPVRKILLVGTGIGLVVGVPSYACPHGLSAVVSGVGRACTAVAAQVVTWFRRSAAALGLAGSD